MNGVNPVELVEVPVAEFQKDFPNDPDAAQRRYERINGARLRILTKVQEDWSRLVAKNWKPSRTRSKAEMQKERILEVPEDSHCALLESQAQQFRKIEQENMNSLQRMLKMEVKKAIAEQMNKDILNKHQDIETQNKAAKDHRKAVQAAAVQAEIERGRKKEEDFMEEIKRQQAYDAVVAKQKAEDNVRKLKREKELREKREHDRVAREEYTRQMKKSIMGNIESKADTNRKMLEMKNALLQERRKDEKEAKEQRNAQRQKDEKEKAQKAKDDALLLEEQDRAAVLQKIKENEEYRTKIIAAREKKRMEEQSASNGFSKDKLQRIKEKTKNDIEDKAMRIQKELDCKDEIARQGLEKVKEAVDKRRCIKSIKKEAFEISSMRAQKVKEYKMDKLNRDIKNKDVRCNAIKKGFQVLNQMRNSMKDIMSVTNSLLKDEISNLKHRDTFDPEEVEKVAMRVTDKVLFPRLNSTFGRKPGGDDLTSEDLFQMDFNDGDFAGKAEAFLKDQENEANGLAKSSSEKKITTKKIDPSITRLDRPHAPMPRTNFATLPVHTMTHDVLESALKTQKERLLETAVSEASPSPPKQGRGSSPSRTKNGTLPGLSSTSSPSMGSNAGSYETADDLRILRETSILDIGDDEGSNPHRHSKSASMKNTNKADVSQSKMAVPDVKGVNLPLFPFTPVPDSETTSEQPSHPAPKPVQTKKKGPAGMKKKEIRTDVNEKAKYLDPPAGKFRREFSTDHPLAAGGTGKYDKEAQKGISPTGLPEGVVQSYGNVKTALETAAKVNKITYAADSNTVDPTKELEKLRTKQNAVLKNIIDEERQAEEERDRLKKTAPGPEDQARLDAIFTEERRRANQRIINATKEHEHLIKEAVLRQMNLMQKPLRKLDDIGKN